MIQYNPKAWFKLIFFFHRTDTFRVLIPLMLCLAVYSALIVYLEKIWFGEGFKSTPIVHSLLGFVISLLLVFRTNTAYERWWEGRRLWGSLLNNARNLSMKLNAFLPETALNERRTLYLLIANFAASLRDHLRNEASAARLEKIDGEPDLSDEAHLPNAVATRLFVHIERCHKTGLLGGEQLLLLNQEVSAFTDICGSCERIKKTPIPYSYSIFLKKFIFIYILTLPFGLVSDLSYWSVAVVVFMFYVLASLELIAEEIEDPFGKDANDLPTDEISRNIALNVKHLLARF